MAVFGIDFEGKPPIYGAVVGLLFGGVLAALGYWQLSQPQQKKIDQREADLKKLQGQIQEGRAAKQKLPQFRKEVEDLELELKDLRKILPARRNTDQLLRYVRTLADQRDFDLRVFKPNRPSDQEFYREWPIQVDLSGAYHPLALFFDQVANLQRLVNVENLKIEAQGKQSDNRTLKATFVAKTFVYNDEAELSTDDAAAKQDATKPKKSTRKGKSTGGSQKGAGGI